MRNFSFQHWAECDSLFCHGISFQPDPEGCHSVSKLILGFEKLCKYEYKYRFGFKNHPITNTNSFRFENICQIWIQILLFLFNYLNTIWIPKYPITPGAKPQTTDLANDWHTIH